jgi:hypothetical protein
MSCPDTSFDEETKTSHYMFYPNAPFDEETTQSSYMSCKELYQKHPIFTPVLGDE